MIQVAQILFILSVLVILHEFGHYLTAKMFKVRVEKFYLFMDAGFSLVKKKTPKLKLIAFMKKLLKL